LNWRCCIVIKEMGKIFSKKEHAPTKICIYGSYGYFTDYSPENLVLQYLQQQDVTSEFLETSKNWIKHPQALDYGSRAHTEQNESKDFQFQVMETGGRELFRSLTIHQEKGAKGRICFMFAKCPEDMEDWHKELYSVDGNRSVTLYLKNQLLEPSFSSIDPGYREARNIKDPKWKVELYKSPVLIFVEALGKEGAKTLSEIELALGLNEANFPYHLQPIDLWNNGHGINDGLQWLKTALDPKKMKRKITKQI